MPADSNSDDRTIAALKAICLPATQQLIERKCRDEDLGISLWQNIDLGDVSQTRFFVIADKVPRVTFEVNFLSRHEIIAPMSVDSLPESWKEWGVRKGNNIAVYDLKRFKSEILTADAFLALPKYRFEALCDDIRGHIAEAKDGIGTPRALLEVLSSEVVGYSFLIFLDISQEIWHDPRQVLIKVRSFLEGDEYENAGLRGLALEQLDLRGD